jgi:hydrogenase-4 component B
MLAAIMLALAGALALASFVKTGSMLFLGAPRTQAAARAHESGPWMRAPMLVLAGVCVLIGLAPVLLWPVVARAVGIWHPAWIPGEAPAPLGTLGWGQVALAVLTVAAVGWLWRKSRSNGLRRGLTWDCAYVAPTAHMQYSGGSLSGIVAGWFGWVLQPQRNLRRPRGVLPAGAFLIERMPETVLERVVTPVGEVVIRISTAVRSLQHGRLQSYILYLVAGLTVLSGIVYLGGRP